MNEGKGEWLRFTEHAGGTMSDSRVTIIISFTNEKTDSARACHLPNITQQGRGCAGV